MCWVCCWCTCDEGHAEHGQEEHLQHEVAIVVHNVARHDGDNSQTEVLDGLHAVGNDIHSTSEQLWFH